MVDLKKFCEALREGLPVGTLAQQQSTQPGTSYTSRLRTTETEGGRYKTDEPLSLGDATVKKMRSEPDAAHKKGIEEWNEWYKLHKDLKVKDWDKSKMEELAGIMSKIFFLDELRHPVRFQWQEKMADMVNAGKGTIYGFASHALTDLLIIRIDPTDYQAEKKLDSHLIAIISTFLHELVHGYLYCFCCDGADKHSDKVCTINGKQVWPRVNEKSNAHCLGWFLIASQISVKMEAWLGLKGHLFPLRSFIGYWKDIQSVSAGDWKLFFSIFSPEEVAQLLGHLHEDGKATERARFETLLRGNPAVTKVWVDWSDIHLK